MRPRLKRIPRPRFIFGAPESAPHNDAGAELLKDRIVQRLHIKIAFSLPFMARDVLQSRAHQHKRGLAVMKIPGSPADECSGREKTMTELNRRLVDQSLNSLLGRGAG